MTSAELDCVVVGFYEHQYGEELAKRKESSRESGAYAYVLGQLVPYRGRRIPYMELFNLAAKQATGHDPNLNLAETPNLGVVVLTSFLRKRGLQVEPINFFNREREKLASLLALSPNAVAITTTYYEDPEPIRRLIEFIRTYDEKTKIIIGGPYIFNLCQNATVEEQEEAFREMNADVYIFDSQGELTLSRVLAELRKPKPRLERIPNLVYPDGAGFERNGREAESNDMDEIAVDWSSFDPSFYAPFAPMRTARSCAYSCAFCSYPQLAGPLKLASLAVVENELRYLHEHGVEYLNFIDDTFNVPLPRFKNILRTMIRNDLRFKWYSYFRCANADDETFDLMRDSGCVGVFLGIESGDQAVLSAMNKHATTAKYRVGIQKLKERGIPTFVSMIIGFPGETRDTTQRTIDFLSETAPSFFAAELYWHSKALPVHQDREKYRLVGEGYSWSHSTMDWREAAELSLDVYRKVRGPVIMPTYTFSIDAVPYLMSKGFSLDAITRFAGAAGEMLVKGFDSTAPDIREQEATLMELFRGGSPMQHGVMLR
jgi:radical SAM PhpK family P-methyltransferase